MQTIEEYRAYTKQLEGGGVQMSELTTPIRIDIPGVGSIESADLYLKSEADKVIAKLEEKLDTTKKLLNKALDCISNGKNHMMSLARKNNHANYKRCLAMAEWCDAEADVADADGDYEDMRWYQKWHKRWLAIAEKFKEAK